MYTGYGSNPFYATFVSSNRGSKIDIYAKYSSYWGSYGNNILGETQFLDSSEKNVNPSVNDWYSATIILNDTVLRRNDISDAAATGTIAHEFGHGFGLSHNNTNKYSIMCQTGSGRQVQKVQKVDHDALNLLY